METVLTILGIIVIILLYQFFNSSSYEEFIEDNKKNKRLKEIFKELGINNPDISSFTQSQKNRIFQLHQIKTKLSSTSTIGRASEESLRKAGFAIYEFPSDSNSQVIKAKTFTNKSNREGFLYSYSFITHKTNCYKITNDKTQQYPEYTLSGVNTVTSDLITLWEGIFATEELKKINTDIIEFYKNR